MKLSICKTCPHLRPWAFENSYLICKVALYQNGDFSDGKHSMPFGKKHAFEIPHECPYILEHIIAKGNAK